MQWKEKLFNTLRMLCVTITSLVTRTPEACRHLVTKGLLQENLIRAHLKGSKKGLELMLGELKTRLVMLVAQLASYRRNNNLWRGRKTIAIIGISRREEILPDQLFDNWDGPTQSNCRLYVVDAPSKTDSAEQQQASSSGHVDERFESPPCMN